MLARVNTSVLQVNPEDSNAVTLSVRDGASTREDSAVPTAVTEVDVHRKTPRTKTPKAMPENPSPAHSSSRKHRLAWQDIDEQRVSVASASQRADMLVIVSEAQQQCDTDIQAVRAKVVAWAKQFKETQGRLPSSSERPSDLVEENKMVRFDQMDLILNSEISNVELQAVRKARENDKVKALIEKYLGNP